MGNPLRKVMAMVGEVREQGAIRERIRAQIGLARIKDQAEEWESRMGTRELHERDLVHEMGQVGLDRPAYLEFGCRCGIMARMDLKIDPRVKMRLELTCQRCHEPLELVRRNGLYVWRVPQ